MNLECGTVLDNYKLLARVGAGSCGSVWQVENIVSGELEALKVLTDSALAERELRALKLYREIEHPALIRIRHIGKTDDLIFYTMDWCECSLAERKVSARELLLIAQKLADGLALLHAKGLLHRDIKPANIFFKQGNPVLGDIGLLVCQEGATFAGSPGFIAPSILSGKTSADRYSDCYALAKSIYCVLSGFGPEQFPLYVGEMSPEASLLMRSIMAVCSDKPAIHNADEFLAFFTHVPQIEIKKTKHILRWTIVNIAVAAGLWWCYDAFHTNPAPDLYKKSKAQRRKVTPEKKQEQQMLRAMDHQWTKDQSRAEVFKKWTQLPLDVEKKLRTLQRSQTAYEIIGISGRGRMRVWPGTEERRFLSGLSAEQQKRYLECCSEIRRIESLPKWQKLSKLWWNADYASRIRKREAEKGIDSMSALQQLAEEDPLLALLVKQGECHYFRDLMIRAANKMFPSEYSVPFGKFTSKAAEYISAFHSLNIPDQQK